MKEQESNGDQQVSKAEQRRQEVELSPDFRSYLDELYQRLPGYASRAATIPAGEFGSVEWLRDVGRFHWEARAASGLTRRQVAERMGVPVNAIRFFEFGVSDRELGLRVGTGEDSREFPRAYAEVIGRPELYSQYRERFFPGQNPPATARAQV